MTQKHQVILDCDTGTDDAVAIMLAALHPKVDLVGVTTVFGNAPLSATTINTLSVLDLIGRPEIPVHAGISRPLVRKAMPSERFFKTDSVADPHGTYLDIPRTSREPASTKAVDYLIETYRSATQPITLMPVGPLTNIAAAVALEPRFAEWVPQLIIMGGGHEVPNMTASAEFNIWADPDAAASVFEAGFRNVLLVPLDATHKALVTDKQCAALGALGTPAGKATETFVTRRINSYEAMQKMDIPNSAPVHDALCVAALVEPDIVTTKRCHVAVETAGALTLGRTVVDTHQRSRLEPNADVALDANADRFVAMLLEVFGQR
ncbi:MAG: nucleoside hydrolase [Candidatus Limnocylindrus sp.]|jgi:inosine-uridine nucleoside N-ribohydrolase|nr:nucleoside hydrolase [Candidatus Aquidulcis sp.]